jgi:hypothetical protein
VADQHAKPASSILLHFDPEHDDGAADEDQLVGQLSSVTAIGRELWLASDEANTLERLTPLGPRTYGRHQQFRLAELLELPGERDEEIDVEGLDHDGGYLWLVGSHGLKRRKAKPGRDAARQIARLAEVRSDGNRFLVARVPLVRGDAGSVPQREAEGRHAARLLGGRDGNVLTEALRGDAHLARFLDIPSKDNGFDVEGIAVRGDRVFLGLRGPVLRGWAVVLELRLEEIDGGFLGLVPGRKRRLYRKHFLDLRGLGVRELCADGDDLLVLAGPTMDLDGPAAVYRWRDAPWDDDDDTLTGRDDLPELVALPYGVGQDGACDHPEGMTPWPATGADARRQLLVVYDSPHRGRMEADNGVRADLFDLPD